MNEKTTKKADKIKQIKAMSRNEFLLKPTTTIPSKKLYNRKKKHEDLNYTKTSHN